MLTLYTVASLALAAITLLGSGKWLHFQENRKLKRVLKNGVEYEALILDARPINPSIVNPENIRLEVQILAEEPRFVTFDYDASYPESRGLVTGNIIQVAVDPVDPHNVLIIRKSFRPPKFFQASSRDLLLAI